LQKVSSVNQWRERLKAYAPLIFWIGVIFFLSSGQGAMTETSRFIRPILIFLFPDAPETTLAIYHGYIRKFAHFAEYAVLAFLASRAFVKRFGYWHILWTLGLTAAIAVLDEVNQSFNPQRTGSEWDVILDLIGGVSGIFVFWLFTRSRSKQAAR
jgi:VanZ family protein